MPNSPVNWLRHDGIYKTVASAPQDRRSWAASTMSPTGLGQPPRVGASAQRSGVQPFELTPFTSRPAPADFSRKRSTLMFLPAAA